MDPNQAIERRAGGQVTLPAEAQPAYNLPYGGADPTTSSLPLRDYMRVLHKNRWMIAAVSSAPDRTLARARSSM